MRTHHQPVRVLSYWAPQSTATADASRILPVYLLHYGAWTAPLPSAPSVPPPLALASGSEKNMAQTEARTSAEPRAGRSESKGGSGKGGKDKGSSKGSAAPDDADRAEGEGALPPALRATKEHGEV